jgi:hypothetical protein
MTQCNLVDGYQHLEEHADHILKTETSGFLWIIHNQIWGYIIQKAPQYECSALWKPKVSILQPWSYPPVWLHMFYVIQIYIKCFNYIMNFTAEFLAAVCRFRQWTPLSAISNLYVSGFSNPGIILFKQQNLMSTHFTCSTSLICTFNLIFIIKLLHRYYICNNNDYK